MSANPIDDNSTPKTTGSLEDLFRHHLGEAAAVPPRPMLWDQIDNSLLIRQNETYRRRLVATRWVAAASLLLATLAGTGWWAGRHELLGGAQMATTSQSAASGSVRATDAAGRPRTSAALPEAAGQAGAALAANTPAAGTTGAASTRHGALGLGANNGVGNAATTNGYASASRATAAAATRGRYAGFGPAASGRYVANGPAMKTSPAAQNGTAASSYAATPAAATAAVQALPATATPAADAMAAATPASAAEAGRTLAAADAAGAGAAGAAAAMGSAAATGGSATAVALAPTVAATTTEEMGLLAARQASLALANAATALPNGLATVPVEPLPAIDAHRWRYSASYAAGVFNPNINFSRAGIEPEFDYNRGPAFGANSPAITEAAATEYRNNLRPGLSQRIALLATRHLRGHWSLSTGAEFTRATAQSASSTAFVGEQLFDLSQGSTAQPLHTTNFSYQMASIPLEVRYSNPAKRGWSLYGRLGGVVTALLGVRSDVQGDPEATRTYSIAYTGGPYRRLMGSVRGGAGAQFRPSTSKWAFSMGPTADLGLVALNAHPVQSYFAQSHPYSLGLEAAVEFGR
ncbi:hypothetical protein [Hymenobacter daeguensis]